MERFVTPSGPNLSALLPLRWVVACLGALILLGGGFALVVAQVSGNRGIAPIASSADIEVRGIVVDARGDNAEEARERGWRQAQRDAWERVGGPEVSDADLAGMVSAIVIQRERIGPKRYIATLGVTFDRQRSARFLGGARQARSSAPMLVIPVMVSAGAYTTFEVRNPWQRAWAEFSSGRSRIDYVRPSGAGGDSLLLNFGQSSRRSRAWWRTTLDQFTAADALTPIARIEPQFPGGPITGTFTARYGPDNKVLGSFQLNADGPGQLPDMLGDAVERIDRIYEEALVEGKLTPDPTLNLGGSGRIDPALQRLVDIGRVIRERERLAAQAAANGGVFPMTGAPGDVLDGGASGMPAAQPTIEPEDQVSVPVQFDTPDPATFDAVLTNMRAVPGVRSLSVTSTAMGGTSVMNVTYRGDVGTLAGALRDRGFAVRESGNTLSISR